MSYETIEYAVEAGVATLTLNRPKALNSFNAQMHEEVRAAIKSAERDENVRCLLITGNGRGFCAGQDLSDRNVAPRGDAPDLGESIEKNYNPLIRKLRALEMPVICAVNGVAAGAGANVALACDIVLAARSASFIQAFCRIGLLPDSGGTWHLPRLVGHARAMGLAMLGDKLSAEQAEAWGMIWRVVDDEQLAAEADALARHLAGQPTKGLSLIKRAINASWHNDLDQQLDLERDLQRAAGRTDDYREGVAAFMDKRDPQFQGK
ncbi:2-(1,2-epoxy-1,2-dihydrophenyl)acetyl-CoA isomerase PaaG [Arhodomonas aquaeolei]|uniref:2-(1,2-epoxy-1,2-dihydrophenyl)acetyl-CoA isomerase PaaG n=1 Tax=Arhodomonas aquaeolei TaxID=2369 RepID=UPI00035F98F5|nr:2-(1,2-epoxy-1,2-dihydrophenyl)acetyl-CoA isomerase PaaG [Arhodomonas aquaeolei]